MTASGGAGPIRRVDVLGVGVSAVDMDMALAEVTRWVDARERHYVIAGSCASGVTEIVKRIAAIPGDRIELGQGGVRVNGERVPGSELLDRDSQGAPLAHAEEGEIVLAAGRYWVMGTHVRRSWDSRYFGPIAREQIVGGARPLWTF